MLSCLQNMTEEKITKKDVKKIVDEAMEKFARFINLCFSEQNSKIDNVESRLDGKIDSVESKLDAKINKLADGNDLIIRELKTMRAETAAAVGGKQRIDDKLFDHEDRIIDLENFTKIKKTQPTKCRTKN